MQTPYGYQCPGESHGSEGLIHIDALGLEGAAFRVRQNQGEEIGGMAGIHGKSSIKSITVALLAL